jgi:hypothetical protein
MVSNTKPVTDIDLLLADMREARQFMVEHTDSKIVPLKEELDRVGKTLVDVEAGLKELRRERLARMTDDGRVRLPSTRMAGLDLWELRLLERMLMGRQRFGISDHSKLLNDIREARTQLRSYLNAETILQWEDGTIKRQNIMHPKGPQADAMSRFKQMVGGFRTDMMMSAAKALDSTTAGAGDELVPTFESAELWMDVNLETLVLPVLQQVAMPTNPYDLPSQFGDTNWYPVDENVQVTTTNQATAKSTLTAYGLKTGVAFSDELDEDAIIRLVPELRANLTRNAAEVIDDVLLNADTRALNGINSDGATISKSAAGKGQWMLGFDGLIKAAIFDNSAGMSINKNAPVDADIYNAAGARLGRFFVPRRRGEVVYITDVNTATRSLSIAEFEDASGSGTRSTLSSGEILSIYGKPLIQSEQMRLADTDGKVTDSGNATNTGRILAFNTTQWRVGFRRQITMETDREPGKSQTTLYVSMRIALTERTGTRSTQTHTAIAYDILGVA